MNDVEERLAYLEGRVEEQGHMVNGIREAMASLEGRIDRRLEQFEQRMDQRFASVDQRFAGVDQRLDSLGAKVDRQGHIMLATLIAIIGGMSGIIAAILQN